MTRSDLVETIARRICASDYERCEYFGGEKCDCSRWHLFTPDAEAALAAISEAGYAVVPREATATMLAMALPVIDADPSDEDKRLGAEACMILEGPRKISGDHRGAVISAAQLAQDYRSMIQAGDVAKETTT